MQLSRYRTLLVTALIWLGPVVGPYNVQAAEWAMDAARSKLEFTVQLQSNPLKGAFETFQVEIDFDPDDPSSGVLDVLVETGSISTGDSQSKTLAETAEWLGSGNFPVARFHSTSIKSVGSGKFEAAGLLTIKEASMPINLEFTLEIDGTEAVAQGSATINRSEFGVGGLFSDSLPVQDFVIIEFVVHASNRS